MRVQLAASSPDDWDAPPAPSPQQRQRRSAARCPTPPMPATAFVAALALAPAPWLLVLLHVRRELDLPVSDVPWLLPQLVGSLAAALALGGAAVHVKQGLERDGPPYGLMATACCGGGMLWVATEAALVGDSAAVRVWVCGVLCACAAALQLTLHALLHLSVRSAFSSFGSSGVFAAGRWLSLASTFGSSPLLGILVALASAGHPQYWALIMAAVCFALGGLGFLALDDIEDRPDPFDTLFFLMTGKEDDGSTRAAPSFPAATDLVLAAAMGLLTASLVVFGGGGGDEWAWVGAGTLAGCVLAALKVHGEHAKPLLAKSHRIAAAGLVAVAVFVSCGPAEQAAAGAGLVVYGRKLLHCGALLGGGSSGAALLGIMHDFHHQSCPRHATAPTTGTILLVWAQGAGVVVGVWLEALGLGVRHRHWGRAGAMALGLLGTTASLLVCENIFERGFWIAGEARRRPQHQPEQRGLDDAAVEGGPRRRGAEAV